MMISVLGQSWAERAWRRGQVLRLTGADSAELLATIDDLPVTAPIVIGYRLTADLDGSSFVDAVLADLRRIVIALFPTWLPGGDESVTGRSELDLAGALAIAQRLSRSSTNFGPFVADMVRRCFDESSVRETYAREVELAGLVRLLAAGYLRRDVALLVSVDPDLPPTRHPEIAHGCEWLAEHGPMCLWITDNALPDVDRFPSEAVAYQNGNLQTGNLLTGRIPAGTAPVSTSAPEAASRIVAPVVEGLPAPHSVAEQCLEASLRQCDWAHGRVWNTDTTTGNRLHQVIRADLVWPAARVVVEVDGDDHRTPAKYAADRLRDNRLQRSGYLVLRYTNEQVLRDVGLVVSELQDVLDERRSALLSGSSREGTAL